MNADFLIIMVRFSVGTLSTPLANEFYLCNGCKALTSCQKQLHLVAISNDILVMLGASP